MKQVAPCRVPLPARRADLVIRALGNEARHVIKNPARGEYFELGAEECFLLMQLDGHHTADDVCAAFEERFSQSLTLDDVDDFLNTAREQGLLQITERRTKTIRGIADSNTENGSRSHNSLPNQSILYWRKKIFDPDRLFNRLEPKIRFCWTRGFFVFSAACIVVATWVLWNGHQQLAASFRHALRWETVLWAWLVLMIVTTVHEFAHGLTCKHFGGEVREIGFLLMYFMPCFYCNVSDAWLFRERSKRLWVTLAGGYFELFVWALAVFVWRITLPGSSPHYLALLVVVSSGVDSFFNFNPLIKLDGYYLLSDWLETPNLQQRGVSRFKAHLRRWIWGAPRPKHEPQGRTLVAYGLASWLYSLTFLSLMLWGMFRYFGNSWGVLGMSAVAGLGLVSTRGLLKGTTAGEARAMLSKRHKRLAGWIVLLGGLAAVLQLVEITDYASGPFEVRAQSHAQLRAGVAAFLTEVNYDEGQNVAPDSVIARLAVPDLDSRIAQKQAELREAQAQLELLRAGPREVEVAQQLRRVAAVQAWRDVAARELERQQQVLDQDVRRLEKLFQEYQAECSYARQTLTRNEELQQTKSVTEEEVQRARKEYLVYRARCDRAVAEKKARIALGTLAAQSTLAEREKELAMEQAALAMLEAGSRPEKIEAAEATIARLAEELSYLGVISSRQAIRSPVAGCITTIRLKEKVGDFFAAGDLICEVEDSGALEVAIALDEDQAARIQPGQTVRLKARSLPFEMFEVQVQRIAPQATKGDFQSKVNVYCSLNDADLQLRSGMTGYAHIECRRATIAAVLTEKCLRFIRTEFWW